MFIKQDETYNEMRKKSAVQWLTELVEQGDMVNKSGARITIEHIEHLNKKIKELQDSNALKDEFLKKMKNKANKI
ncbi:MAG: hypothetical protein RSB66_06445 [Clostridium sp.]